MSRVLTVVHLHRLLVRLHPRWYRETFGASIAWMLSERLADARRGGVRGRVRFWIRETSGLLRSLIIEHMSLQGARGSAQLNARPRRIGPMETMTRELRQAGRRLLRAPVYALSVLLTLTLAMGATVAVFTLVRRVVLAPLPYAESDRLVMLDHGGRGLDRPSGMGITSGLYALYAESAGAFESLALTQRGEVTLSGNGEPERITALRVTPSLAQVLRTSPGLGRWFAAAEGEAGAPAVAVLTHGLWQRRFGGDRAILGRALMVNGMATEVIGVMPAGFAFPDASVQILLPLPYGPAMLRAGGFNFQAIGRLAAGSTIDVARAGMDALIARLVDRFPDDPVAVSIVHDGQVFAVPQTMHEWLVGSTARTLWLLLGAAVVLLLVAGANVTNLFLVRAELRQREVAVRRALGADAGTLAGFHLSESALLGVASGVLGLGVGVAAVGWLAANGPANLPRLHEVRVDATVVGFAALLSVIMSIAFGAVALLRRTGSLAGVLHDASRGNTAGTVHMRMRNLLMGTQVALAFVLLVSATLLARSFLRLMDVDPGFDASDRLAFQVALTRQDYATAGDAAAFHDVTIGEIAALPGVESATLTSCAPLTGACWWDPLLVVGREKPAGEWPIVSFLGVGANYFETLGIELIAGRTFDAPDFREDTRVAVIDERLASTFFPGEDPLGRMVARVFEPDGYTIIGMVRHVAANGLSDPQPPPQMYSPLVRTPPPNAPTYWNLSYIVRTSVPPLEVVPAIRTILHSRNPHVAMARVRTLEGTLEDARAPSAFTLTLIALAAVVTLLLGLIGIHGVIAWVVTQRTSEIGVRLALGARPHDVSAMVMRQAGAVAVAGVIVGLGGALLSTRLLRALLFQVDPADPVTYLMVGAALLAMALFACWLPARRAARLDPLRALRMP